jgi:phosphomannomutase
VDERDAAELRALLAAGDTSGLTERFAAALRFGTAGLRGPMRAGPNGMNTAVVRRAAAGLAAWLARHGHRGAPLLVGFDARHRSAAFAGDSAAVLAAAGFDALLLPGPLPTPVLAFAVRRLGAAAGVMVTASHNPAGDNGYKVYAADGAQIVEPMDAEIEEAIQAVGPTRAIPLAAERVRVLEDTVVEDYVAAVAAVAALPPPGSRRLRVVHTALHGVGDSLVRRVFTASGFAAPIPVPQQQRPDPDFPTVAFPNPEEPGALDLALRLAADARADLVLANDPDADRCAAAVPEAGRWRVLTGDEVGVLLADCLLRQGVRGTYATTLVSSSMLGAMAARHGAGYAETPTGFKWIMRAAPDLVFGYEEALGYAVAPRLVRDKDGISAALTLARLASALEAEGSSLGQRLAELGDEYGHHATGQIAIRPGAPASIEATMRRLRARPPRTLLGAAVEVSEPGAAALRWTAGEARVVLRPSGTEPKLKAYLQVVRADGAAAAEALAALRDEVGELLASDAQSP